MENKNISCTVKKCRFHSEKDNFCCLDSIKVGFDGGIGATCHCTCCKSFSVRDD